LSANLAGEPKRNPDEIPQEKLEESSFYKDIHVREPTLRERTATIVAYTILVLFCVTLLVSFAFAFYVLHRANSVDEKTVDTSLASLKTTATTFTPLLAFILGYYFTKKEEG